MQNIANALWEFYAGHSYVNGVEVDGWMVWMEFPADTMPVCKAVPVIKNTVHPDTIKLTNPVIFIPKRELDNDADNIHKLVDRIARLYDFFEDDDRDSRNTIPMY